MAGQAQAAARAEEAQLRARVEACVGVLPLKLSAIDQDALTRLLVTEPDYQHHDVFDQADAERRVFDEAPAVPDYDPHWFLAAGNRSGLLFMTPPPPLTIEQERAAFAQLHFCRHRMAGLRDSLLTACVPQDARELLAWHAREQSIRRKIIHAHLRLVFHFLHTGFRGQPVIRSLPGLEVDDVVAEGARSLIEAVDRFKMNGARFSTYAINRMMGRFAHLMDRCRRERFVLGERVPLVSADRVAMGVARRCRRDHDEALLVDELRRMLRKGSTTLADDERAVIDQCFRMNRSTAFVAGGRGVPREEVDAQIASGLAKLHQGLERRVWRHDVALSRLLSLHQARPMTFAQRSRRQAATGTWGSWVMSRARAIGVASSPEELADAAGLTLGSLLGMLAHEQAPRTKFVPMRKLAKALRLDQFDLRQGPIAGVA
jgi:RNA polymerase sigma factor (sigma-70 family)